MRPYYYTVHTTRDRRIIVGPIRRDRPDLREHLETKLQPTDHLRGPFPTSLEANRHRDQTLTSLRQ